MTIRTTLVTIAVLAQLTAAGCSSDSAPAESDGGARSRPHQGAVHVLLDGGTRRVKLELAQGYPRASLGTRFTLELAGTADAGSGPAQHGVTLVIDPIKETPSYEFPRDRDQLAVAVQRAAQPRQVGSIAGFLRIVALDEGDQLGSAVISLALNDSAGYGLIEIDITLPAE